MFRGLGGLHRLKRGEAEEKEAFEAVNCVQSRFKTAGLRVKLTLEAVRKARQGCR